MGSNRDEITAIKTLLKDNPQGMTVTKIARAIDMSRNSVAKYLEMMLVSGEAEMRTFGPSKVYYLSHRLPVSAMFSLTSDLIVVMDEGLVIRNVNEPFLKLVGREEKDMLNRPAEGSTFPILSDREMIGHLREAVDGKEFAQEVCVRKRAKELYYNARLVPAVYGDGRRGVTLVMEDITERKRAEVNLKDACEGLEQKVRERTAELEQANQALSASESKYRQLVELAQEGIWAVDGEGRTTFVNPRMAGMLGYTAEEMMGRPREDFMDEAGVQKAKIWMERRRQGYSDQYDFEFVRRDGSRLMVSMETSPIFQDGRFAGSLALIADITARKQAEESLRKAVRELRAQTECIGAVVHAGDEAALLHDICRIMVVAGGYRLAWVGYAEPDGSVRPAAWHGYDEGYLEKITVRWDDSGSGRGPVGTAIRTGRHAVTRDIDDASFALWTEDARVRGYSSVLAVPLATRNGVIGALALYSATRDAFDRQEIRLIEDIAGDVAFGIDSLRQRREHDAAENALRESEERFRRVFDESPLGAVLASVDYRFLRVNDRMAEITGYSKAELLSAVYTDITYPDDRAITVEKSRELVDGRAEHVHYEKRYVRKDGSITWVHVSLGLVRDPSGAPLYFAGTVEDITERIRMMAALRESEENLSLAQKNANIGTWALDVTTDSMRWTGEVFKIFGLSSAGYAPSYRGFLNLVMPEDRDRVDAAMQASLQHGAHIDVDFKAINQTGEVRHINCVGDTTFEDGRAVRLVGVCLDITGRKRAEEELRASETRYRELFSAAEDAIVIVAFGEDGLPGRILEANEASSRLTGYPPAKLLSLSVWDLIAPEDSGVRPGVMESLMAGKRVFLGLEIVASDGHRIPIEVSCHLLQLADRVACMAIARDVSEREKTALEIERSLSLLQSSLESTADAIVVADLDGRFITHNRQFRDIFRVPAEIISAGDERAALDLLAGQTKDPGGFLARVREIYATPYEDAFDLLEMADGRAYERSSRPLLAGRHVLGRVWSFHDLTERRRYEQKLIESEEKFRVLSESSSAAIMMHQGADLIYVNPAVSQMTGYTQAELLKMKFWEIFDPAYHGLVQERARMRLNGEAPPARYELKLATRDGGERWMDLTASTMQYQGGLAVIAIGLDVTARKEAERTALQRETEFNALAEASPAAILLHQGDHFLYVNPAAERLTGYRRAELLGMKFWEIFDPGMREMVRAAERSRLTGGEPVRRYEAKLATKDGSERWMDIAFSVMGYRGAPTVVATALDITQRKKAEEALIESEQKLRGVISQATEGILIVDEQGRVIEFNQAAEQIYGVGRETVLGRYAWDFLFSVITDDRKSGEAYDRIRSGTLGYLKTGFKPDSIPSATTIQRHDGRRRDILTANFPIRTARGYMIGSIVTDITERRQAERTMRESLEMLQSVARTAEYAIIVCDEKGFIRFWNQAAERIFGYAAGEVEGQSINVIVPEEVLSLHQDRFGKAGDLVTDGGYTGHTVARAGKRKDGTLIDIEISLSGWKADGARHYTAIIRDVSGEKVC
ncbi:MAG: Bacterioopsin transcriptional activator [Methanocella sp. PtaU1.Bin125]|nr:MAG: Bacterioopsin transcriptional activator [Methanocella sp. PtaU1.Bin125]